jgi:hypothetical protein
LGAAQREVVHKLLSLDHIVLWLMAPTCRHPQIDLVGRAARVSYQARVDRVAVGPLSLVKPVESSVCYRAIAKCGGVQRVFREGGANIIKR